MIPTTPDDPTTINLIEQGIPLRAVTITTVNQANVIVSRPFGFSAGQARAPILADYSATGAAFTACTAFLQQSFDGGVTFQDVGTVVDLFANPQGNLTLFFAVSILVSGPVYRFRIATVTATSLNIDVAVS